MPGLPDDPGDVYNRRAFAYASTTVVLVLSIISYILRLGARKRSGQPLRADDWLMGVGLLISFLPAICEYILLANGVGYHVWNVPHNQLDTFSKTSFALQRANQPSLTCIKLSILFLYLRLFPNKTFAFWAYVNMVFTVCWGISTWIVNLNVCHPIAFFWDKTIPGGYCTNQAISGTVNACLSLFGDVCILILPIPMVLWLSIDLRRKLALLGLFLLGTLVCVSSAIRIVAVINFVITDPTYTQVYAACWTYIEMGCAVIAGNLPLLRTYFESCFRIRASTLFTRSRSSKLQSSSKNNFSRSGRGGGGGGTGDPSRVASAATRSKPGHDGFERIRDDVVTMEAGHGAETMEGEHGSEVELRDRNIMVKTDLTVTSEAVRDLEERRRRDTK